MTELFGIVLITVGNLAAFVGIIGVSLATSTYLTGQNKGTTSTAIAPLMKVFAHRAKTLVIAVFCMGAIFLGSLLVYYGIALEIRGTFVRQGVCVPSSDAYMFAKVPKL